PLFKLVRFLLNLQHEDGFDWPRLAVRLTTVCLLLIATLFMLPADVGRTAPGIVEFDPPSTVRAPVVGFIAEVFVENGQSLEQGQPILRIENDELVRELSSVRTQLEQAKQNARAARWDADSSKLGELNAELSALEAKAAELTKQVDGLLVKAPGPGKLLARNIENRIGVFVEEGQELASIGNRSKKRLKISLPVWDANRVDQWCDAPIRISIAGKSSWLESLSRIETRASDRPADPSITAVGGGSLPVLQSDSEEEPTLTEPRVNAYICLDAPTSDDLQCGQRCYVRLSGWRRSLATMLYENLAMRL
ncbi:MAG: efflux RND transporter periplasmic adaptor subunit, partial [Planctomycetota bacterium]